MNGTMIDRISADEIAQIHAILTEKFANSKDPISPSGIKDRNMLESSAARAFQSVGTKAAYGTIHKRAAALFHSLINNHPFYNGNKRTALIAAQVLLAYENFWLHDITDNQIYEFTKKAAAHKLSKDKKDEISDITKWFEANTRKIRKGEYPLTLRALGEILKKFGYRTEISGEFVNIYDCDGKHIERIIKRGIQGFAPYDSDYISGLRKRLNLDSKNGCDSDKFYGDKGLDNIASELIDLRVRVMKRLAKT